jgi:Na+-transporting NADH:ubiquinone oxidoreductase subunit E
MEVYSNPLIILFAAIFTNNIIFANFLGMCSFVALSKKIEISLGMGMAVTFVSTITSAINWGIYNYFLKDGATTWLLGSVGNEINLEIFTFISFIAVIAAFVQIVEMAIEKFSTSLYHAMGIFLPLITVNCAILGVSLFMIIREYTFIQALTYGFGAGAGYTLAILTMAGIRKKLRYSNIPAPLEGIGITMITTAIMAMAFMGFNGMVNF